MTDSVSPVFPTAKDEDDDDVAWALSTAQVQWKRGSPADALVWLRRAVDAAVLVGATWRAAELTRQTDALEAELLGGLAAPADPNADFAEERTEVTLLDEAVVEVSEVTDEIDPLEEYVGEADVLEGDISEGDISEDDLGDVALPRFPSEPPPPDLPAVDEDPLPTPVRTSIAAPVSAPAPAPAPAPAVEAALTPPTEAALTSAAEPVPPPAEPWVAGISLAEISGFEDFPPETQMALAQAARVERLATEEEVTSFGLALVLRGAVNVMPAIADVSCGSAAERQLVYGKGTLKDGVALRLVAAAPDTQVAIWDLEIIELPLAACPWVLEELQALADRYQALAGVGMGPMGERFDDSLRGVVLSRCQLVRLLPGEVLVEKGNSVGGLFIVGAGRIQLGADAGSAGAEGELGPGDFLFAAQVLSGGAAPTGARAGASGALVMTADRHVAHELMLSVPPLLELLAG